MLRNCLGFCWGFGFLYKHKDIALGTKKGGMALSGVTKIHRYGKTATFKVVRIWPQQSVEFITLKCFGHVPVQTHDIFQRTHSMKENGQSFFSAPSAFSVYMYLYAKNLVNISCFHPEPDFLVEVCLISENPN